MNDEMKKRRRDGKRGTEGEKREIERVKEVEVRRKSEETVQIDEYKKKGWKIMLKK